LNSFVVCAATLVAGVAVSCAAKADTFVLNYENPGVENSTATFSVKGVETFDSRSTGVGAGFATDFGTGGAITGTYSGVTGVQINSADQYGGAGGTGNYIVAFNNTPYSLTLANDYSKNPNGINYFGYWLSALDIGNQVDFYRGGALVGSLTPSQVLASINARPDASSYFGNPNSGWMQGKDSGEPFVFVNFYDTTGTFDKVVFSESPIYGGGYESDNHTVGFYTSMGAVPEPSTWAMMMLGFAGLGFASYRVSRKAAVAA
jgi:hypothetical protein